MSTHFPKHDEAQHHTYLVDVKGMVLGRAAARVAFYLRGKERVDFTPNVNMGNLMIIVNAASIVIKGDKWESKFYAHHTGFPNGLKKKSLKQVFEKDPSKVFFQAVKGMMPKNIMGNDLLKKLKVYNDDKHPHDGQKPMPLEI